MKFIKRFLFGTLIIVAIAEFGIIVFLNWIQPSIIKTQTQDGAVKRVEPQESRIPENAPVRREERVTHLLRKLQEEQDTRRKNQMRDLVRKTFAELQNKVPADDLLALCDQHRYTFLIPNWIKDNDFSEQEFGIDLQDLRTGVRKEKAEAFLRVLAEVANGTWQQPKKSAGSCYKGEGAYFRPDDMYDVGLEIMELKEDVAPSLFEELGMTDRRIRELLKQGAIAEVVRWRKNEEDDWAHNPESRLSWAINKGWATIEEFGLTQEEIKKLAVGNGDN